MSDVGTVGKYTLRRVLGKGAMGVVYEAFDPMIERTVALKTIRKDLWESEDGAELKERFLREARAAGRLLHPNIVTVYEFGEADGGAFIVMEHVSGRTLKEMIDSGSRFSVDETVRLLVPVLAALGYSHRAGVIHRDIKPANVMVTEDGQVKILDFGVARLASASITQVGTILGTPAYMAPEQLMGQAVDARADLYSAGVILREMLCGHKTFSGDYGNVLHQVLHGQPPLPSTIEATVPPAFDTIVARAMARQPEDRFATAEDFIEALRHPAAVVAAAASAPRPVKRASRALPIAAGVALLLLAGGGAAAWKAGLIGDGQLRERIAARSQQTSSAPAEPAAPALPATPVSSPEPARRAVVLEIPPAPPRPAEPAAPIAVAPEVKSDPAPTPTPVVTATPPAPEPPPPSQAADADELSRPVSEPPPPPTKSEIIALLSQPTSAPPPAPVPVKPVQPVLTVVTDRGTAPRYKVGETMQVTVNSDRQTELYCFYKGSSGGIVRVFPTRFAPDATIKPRQPVKLPGKQPFSFQFDKPRINEEVRCLGIDSATAAKLPKVFGGAGFEPVPAASFTALIDLVRQTAGEDVAMGGVVVTVE